MSWRLFIGASILGAALLLNAGAPLLPVALGIILAALWTRVRIRAAARKGQSA
ncbi:MAG: hypothetical protein ABI652_02580 [Acidobacteriota bacterium]